jgi:hypothetical protein
MQQIYGADKVCWHSKGSVAALCTVACLIRRVDLRCVMRGTAVRSTVGNTASFSAGPDPSTIQGVAVKSALSFRYHLCLCGQVASCGLRD